MATADAYAACGSDETSGEPEPVEPPIVDTKTQLCVSFSAGCGLLLLCTLPGIALVAAVLVLVYATTLPPDLVWPMVGIVAGVVALYALVGASCLVPLSAWLVYKMATYVPPEASGDL